MLDGQIYWFSLFPKKLIKIFGLEITLLFVVAGF
tara:strand:- start:1437 stop:1538 length:102 start_codon:yes stop_codon:yes gene_type:complete